MTTAIPEPVQVGPTAWVLLEQHRPDLIRLARARGCGREDAEDLASEALLRAAGFRGLDPERAGAFLNTVLQRLVVDKHRQDQRHQRLYARVAERGVVTSHEEAVCDRHDAAVALGRLADLPQTERAVLVARAQGAPISAIAARMHLSPKTVEGAYTRARGRVRRMLVAAAVGFGAGLRRHAGKVTTTTVAVPVAFLLVPATWSQPHEGWSAPATPVVELSAVDHRETARVREPVRQRAAARPAQPTRRASTSMRRAAVEPPVSVVAPHPAVHDEDETLLQSVVRCAQDGPQVSAQAIGCAPKS